MIRWTDLIGVASFATAVLANLLLFPDSAEHMNWMYWLPASHYGSWGLAPWSGSFCVGRSDSSKTGRRLFWFWSARHSQEREVHLRSERKPPRK